MRVTQLYLITNTCNGKQYVGFTELGLQKRWAKHLKDSQNPQYPLHRAIAKYGADKFTMVSIYESLDKDHISSLEEQFIQIFDSRVHGYNVALGGRGGNLGQVANQKRSQTILNRSPEEAARLRENQRASRKKAQSQPEIVEAKSLRMQGNKFALGHRHSEDLKLQWSVDRTGLSKSTMTKQRMSCSAVKNNNGQRFNIRASCLCCHREWDIGNYTKHIKRGVNK
jgi:group I intron endonuclease